MSPRRLSAARGPIDVLEAAYSVEPTREAWLREVLDRTAAIMPSNVGMTGYFVDVAGPHIECVITSGAARFHGEDVLAVMQTQPRDALRKLYLGPHVASTMSEAPALVGVDEQMVDAFFGLLVPPTFPDPIRDILGVLAFDAEGRGVVLTAACSRRTTLDRATRRRWTLVGVHIAAAARLRRMLEASASEPVAILRADGRVEHAEGSATSKASREALSARAVAIDRARGRLRRSDADAALEMWRGLVTGRWSLVDRVESDGRRYVVAHVNEPLPARMLSLTLRERQVVGHALLAHSSKLTAYALGISPAAVSGALKSAFLKLGVRSTSELVHLLPGAAKEPGSGQPG